MYSYFDSTTAVTPFGLIFVAAIIAAWYFARRNAATTYVAPSHVDLLVPLTIITGLIGGTIVAMFILSSYFSCVTRPHDTLDMRQPSANLNKTIFFT